MGKPSRKLVNRYTDDFKLKAVALSNGLGVLIKDVADSLRVHPGMLSRCHRICVIHAQQKHSWQDQCRQQ